MNELNPNHPVTAAVHDHWHKIVALLIEKFELGHVVITAADLAKLEQGSAVVIKEKRDGLHVWIVNEREAERLARDEGGLPT